MTYIHAELTPAQLDMAAKRFHLRIRGIRRYVRRSAGAVDKRLLKWVRL